LGKKAAALEALSNETKKYTWEKILAVIDVNMVFEQGISVLT
jgi:hypothetical protein